jgi:UDP-N-acetylmuramoyl-tripeptide--D-alanyl-D-alanine ligase
MNFTLSDVARALELPPPDEARLSGAAVDSRTVRPGDLFIALPGARVDGHDFAPEAISRGAAAVLAERELPAVAERVPVLVVPEAKTALLSFAAWLKRRAGFRLAAIAGSAGKTTTKEFAATILARHASVGKTPGNQNSAIGFPLSVVNLSLSPEWMVGEMGMSAAGEISRLSRTFEPDIAAITLIALEHLEFLGSLDGIARANAEILEGLRPSGAFVVNADDARVVALAAGFSGRTLTFAREAPAEVRVEHIVMGDRGSRFRLKTPAGESAVEFPLPGSHQVSNFLAASAVAIAAGATAAHCAEAAPKLAPASHRGEARRHASGALLYDDAYNASPPSMRAALDTLVLLPGKRKIAVLGDMRELGPESEWWHRETGRYVIGRADRLICVGPLGRYLAEGAVEAGFPSSEVRVLDSPDQAANLLDSMLDSGDAVLFKASRGVGLEKTVERLAVPDGRETGGRLF